MTSAHGVPLNFLMTSPVELPGPGAHPIRRCTPNTRAGRHEAVSITPVGQNPNPVASSYAASLHASLAAKAAASDANATPVDSDCFQPFGE